MTRTHKTRINGDSNFYNSGKGKRGFSTEPECYLVNLTNCSIVLFVLDISLDEENISVYKIYLACREQEYGIIYLC